MYIILCMIETGPHIFSSKQFSKNESLDRTTKELKLTSGKSIHFKPMYYLQRITTYNTSMCKQNRFWEQSKKILLRSLAQALPE